MNQIQMWQLFVDIGLITSVLTMTVRAFKSSRIPSMLPQTRELEASLRTLIGEAERAGHQLNDQLLRREQNIQKSLSEMQGIEERVMRALAEGESLQTKLQATRTETIRLIQDLKSGLEMGAQAQRTRYEDRMPQRANPTHIEEAAPRAAQQSISASSESRASVAPQGEEFVAQTYSRSATTQGVQYNADTRGQQEAKAPISPLSPQELKRVYESAESMIRQGQAIESVASQMKLPVDGVRRLAQMIEIERDEDIRRQEPSAKLATTDSRLGALGSIRRQTSTL